MCGDLEKKGKKMRQEGMKKNVLGKGKFSARERRKGKAEEP